MSKRSTLSCSDGFTLVELLVALVVAMAVTAGALALALSSRKMYETDYARTQLNQNLRASKDFLTSDIRQAGERLTTDFPALEIVNGASGAPDALIVRRNLLDTVMRSCREVTGSGRRIYIAELDAGVNPKPPGCTAVPDSDGDTWPDNHRIWRDYRLANGVPVSTKTAVRAYIFNPTNGQGEFFWYWADNKNNGFIRTPPGQSWANTYPVADQCRVYILEERRYELSSGLLQITVNGDTSNPINLVENIEEFQARAVFQGSPPTVQDGMAWPDNWANLRAIEVTVEGRVPFDGEFIDRGWSAEIMPRNVLSW